jgi:hypothetical protein
MKVGSFYKRQLDSSANNLEKSIDQSDKSGMLVDIGGMLRLVSAIVSIAGEPGIAGKLEQMGNDLIGRSK